MILSHAYHCGGDTTQSTAVLACVNSGCQEYALMCGLPTCHCMATHQDHMMVQLDSILKKVAQTKMTKLEEEA